MVFWTITTQDCTFLHTYICLTKQAFIHTWWVIACPNISYNCTHTGCRQKRHRGPCTKTRHPRNMLNEFRLNTLSYNCTPGSVCMEFLKKLLGGRGRRTKQYQRGAMWCWWVWKSHLANCLQDAFQVTASQEAAGFVGLNWKLRCFLLSLSYLTDGSLISPWALAGIRIWCIPL